MPNQAFSFMPLGNKKISEQICDQVRRLIFSGVLNPGDKLASEKKLADQFQIGRSTVREALRTLEQAGFTYVKQGSDGGTFIKAIDSKVISRSLSDMIRLGNIGLLHLTEARLEIEKTVLEFVGKRIIDDDLEVLRKNIEESEKLVCNKLRAGDSYLNFHLILAKSSRSPVFELVLQPLMDIVSSYLRRLEPGQEYSYRVLNFHKEIYNAIAVRDIRTAKEKMETHLLDVEKQLLNLLEDSRKNLKGTSNNLNFEAQDFVKL